MRTKYVLSLHVVGIMAVGMAAAQANDSTPREQFTLGVFAGFGLNDQRAAFSVERDGSLSAAGDCGRFEHGTSTTPIIGLTAELPLAEHWRAAFDAQYQQRGSTLRYPCVDPAGTRLPDGTVVAALTDHVATITASGVAARLSIEWRPTSLPLFAKAGPAILLPLGTARYSAHEEIVTPSNAEFVSGGQVLNYGDGALSSGLSFAVAGSLTWHAPISDRLSLAPEISGILPVGSEVGAIDLRTTTVQATLGLLYRFDHTPQQPTPPVAVVVPTVQTPPPTLDVELTARAQMPDGTETDTLVVEQTGLVTSRLFPLLSYVFFEEADASIPARYQQRSAAEATRFSEDQLRALGTLDIYHNLLDIIGLRMQRYPAATITLTGTQPDAPAAGDRLTLAQQRADRVKQYLVDVWGLTPARIATAVRVDPVSRTNPDTREGASENRRVEIASTTYQITEPLLLADTTAESIAPPAWLAPRATSPAGIETWRIVVSGGPKHDAIFEGSGMPPAHLDLPRDFIREAAMSRPAAFTTKLTVRDRAGEETSDSARLPLRWIDNLNDIRFGAGTYSLILFDFNSAQLRSEHLRTVDLVNARTDSSAHAGVAGYTDMLGPDELNQTLSSQRAAAVASRIKARVDNTVGRGETTLLYDNTLPEGRFYSRTVTIEIRTP